MSNMASRLKKAREAAGFGSVKAVVDKFGWAYSTYAGHENGHRGIKSPDLEKYADAFGVSVAWLISGKKARPSTAQEPAATPTAKHPAGFRESPVAPFVGRSDTERRRYGDIARMLADDARHISLHRLGRDCPGYMLANGDILVVNMHPEPRDGQLVIAQVSHPPSGEVTTEIAQYLKGILVPPHGFAGDFSEYAILGAIEASIRPYR